MLRAPLFHLVVLILNYADGSFGNARPGHAALAQQMRVTTRQVRRLAHSAQQANSGGSNVQIAGPVHVEGDVTMTSEG